METSLKLPMVVVDYTAKSVDPKEFASEENEKELRFKLGAKKK